MRIFEHTERRDSVYLALREKEGLLDVKGQSELPAGRRFSVWEGGFEDTVGSLGAINWLMEV